MREYARKENDMMVVRLINMEKAYPRVTNTGLWLLVEIYGMKRIVRYSD